MAGPAAHKPPGQTPLTTTTTPNKGKVKAEDASSKPLPGEDYAILLCLALSDHSLVGPRPVGETDH
jgi:hypothetical protein